MVRCFDNSRQRATQLNFIGLDVTNERRLNLFLSSILNDIFDVRAKIYFDELGI